MPQQSRRPANPQPQSKAQPKPQGSPQSQPKAAARLEVVAIKAAVPPPVPEAAAEVPAAPSPGAEASAGLESPAAGGPEGEAKPKKKQKKARPARPPIPFPADADELLALDLPGLDRLCWEVGIRQAKAHGRRAQALAASPLDENAVAQINAELSKFGQQLNVLQARRAQLRVQARRAIGNPEELTEAIAIAASRLLHGSLYQRLMKEAERIVTGSAADLAAEAPQDGPSPAPAAAEAGAPADPAAPAE